MHIRRCPALFSSSMKRNPWRAFLHSLIKKLHLPPQESALKLPEDSRRMLEDLAADQGLPLDALTGELLSAELRAARLQPDLQPSDSGLRWVVLTETERDIARLLAEGLADAQIARKKVLAVDTVRTHVRNIRLKYGARNRPALVEAIRRELES